MNDSIELLDVVALMEDITDKGLVRGQVGTVVEVLSPNCFEVEFVDDGGRTYGLLPLKSDQLIVLHHAPVKTS